MDGRIGQTYDMGHREYNLYQDSLGLWAYCNRDGRATIGALDRIATLMGVSQFDVLKLSGLNGQHQLKWYSVRELIRRIFSPGTVWRMPEKVSW